MALGFKNFPTDDFGARDPRIKPLAVNDREWYDKADGEIACLLKSSVKPVEAVWRLYTLTGDRPFVQDMWPAVKKAVANQRLRCDPENDGFFQDGYEYWNADFHGKGPKSATSSAISGAMLDRAACLAVVVGDSKAEVKYRDWLDDRAKFMDGQPRPKRFGLAMSDNGTCATTEIELPLLASDKRHGCRPRNIGGQSTAQVDVADGPDA